MSPTQRVALMAKYKLYISGGGSPEMCEDGHCQSSDKTRKRLKRKMAVVPPNGGGTFWVSAFRLRTSDGSRFEFGTCAGQPGQQTSLPLSGTVWFDLQRFRYLGYQVIFGSYTKNVYAQLVCERSDGISGHIDEARQPVTAHRTSTALTCVYKYTPEHWTYQVAPSSPVVLTCRVKRGSVR